MEIVLLMLDELDDAAHTVRHVWPVALSAAGVLALLAGVALLML